jgi:V/A-type H+/Na+-transporting ATPase subunit K
MLKLIVVIAAGLIPMVPAVIFFVRKCSSSPIKATRRLILGLNGFNGIVGLMAAGIGLVWLVSPSIVLATEGTVTEVVIDPYVSLAAALATGMATIGAGIAVSSTGAAAIGAIAEKPEAFGRSLIFVGLAEGIAIYGLIISFLLLNQ